ncbi:MAG: hypothetical protein U9Q15_04115 [Patescibacteria group bacterium]|nr:hypothetical protein [Patescibacteria group bacterium]
MGAIVQAIFNYIVIITTSLAVMMIIVGGIQYMTGNVDDGKERIKNALVGLLLLLFTGALLHLINPGFFTG